MASSLYTPFLSEAGGDFADAIKDRRAREEEAQIKELTAQAYMETPGQAAAPMEMGGYMQNQPQETTAMQQLMMADPPAAIKLENLKLKKAAEVKAARIADEERLFDRQDKLQDELEDFQLKAATFDTLTPEAQTWFKEEQARIGGMFPELGQEFATSQIDEEDLAQFQQFAKGAKSGMASAKTEFLHGGMGTIQALPSGNVIVKNAEGNLVEGKERIALLKQSTENKLAYERELSDIAIHKAQMTANAKHRSSRISDMTKEYTGFKQTAARSEPRLREALMLADKATQGWTGEIKLGLAKIFPDIDVSSEGAFTRSFRTLAMDELAKFKGPTTDFEYGVAQSSIGTLGDPKTANIARVKSLQRNNYFVYKEAEQFQDFVKSGGNPDTFSFNFGEPVKTKKGIFTLQDLQDTAVQNNLSIEDVLKRLN